MEIIKKDKLSIIEKDKVKFELKRVGPDLLDHEGLDWIYLNCPHCGVYSKFTPKSVIMVEEGTDNDYEDVTTRGFHHLAMCEFCNDIIYVKCYDLDFDPDWWFDYEYHHPKLKFNITESIIPINIIESLREAHTCIHAGAFLASLVMCRRTIEALLNEKGISKGVSLAKGIKKLEETGELPESMINSADLIRLIGNTGAHFTNKKIDKKEQAYQAYELTKNLLEIIYVLPDKITKIKYKMNNIES